MLEASVFFNPRFKAFVSTKKDSLCVNSKLRRFNPYDNRAYFGPFFFGSHQIFVLIHMKTEPKSLRALEFRCTRRHICDKPTNQI